MARVSHRGGNNSLADGADAAARPREECRMRRDGSRANALMLGADSLANASFAAAVTYTNRPGAFDPAMQRGAACMSSFARLGAMHSDVMLEPLHRLGFSERQIAAVVRAAGSGQEEAGGLTFSDLMQRLPLAVASDDHPDGAVGPNQAILPTHDMIRLNRCEAHDK